MPELRATLADEHGTPLERLHRLVDFQVRWFREHPHFGRLYLRHPDRDMDATIEANYEEAMHLEAELFRSGQADGTFRPGDPEALARLFSGLMGAFQALDPAVMSDDPDAGGALLGGRAARPRRGHLHRGCPPWLTPPARPRATGSARRSCASSATACSPTSSSTGPRRATRSRPPMYFGIRYAIDHVNREPDLAGLLITGSRRRVHPRRRARRGAAATTGATARPARHGHRAVRRGAPVAEADRVRGERHLPGRRDDDRDAQRRRGGVRAGHVPRPRAVPRHRRHPLRPDPPAPDRPGPRPRHAADRPQDRRRHRARVGPRRRGSCPTTS